MAARAGKFGPNGEQVGQFLQKARAIEFGRVEELSRISIDQEVHDAKLKANGVPRYAARNSAVSSAAQNLFKEISKDIPPRTSTAERLTMLGFTNPLTAAVFALELRPKLDDDTAGLVVNPIASRWGFEWRSWGWVGRVRAAKGDD